MQPKVSVLIPVYRTKEKYLRETIESVLNQTFKDFELILLDDCPEDTREAVVKSYADPRIVYSKNDRNLGITPTRNKLIDMARGEYLAVCDHDDVSVPTRFAHEVAYLDEHLDVGVVSGLTRILGGSETQEHPENDEDIRYRLMEDCYVSHPSAMIRKAVLEKSGIRYEEYYSPSEDYALWCRLIPVTKFHNLQEVVLEYRVHETNTTKLQHDKMRRGWKRVQALNQVVNPILWREMQIRSVVESHVKVFGIRVWTIREDSEYSEVRLFGIPIVKTRRWRMMDSEEV